MCCSGNPLTVDNTIYWFCQQILSCGRPGLSPAGHFANCSPDPTTFPTTTIRLAGNLLAIAAITFAASDALSAFIEAESNSHKNQAAVKTISSGDNTIGRALRARENVDDANIASNEDLEKEVLKDEERTLSKLDRVVSDLTDDAAKATVKLTRTKSISSVTLDEELLALKKFYNSLKDTYRPLFKNFAEVEKLNPKQAAEKWGIWHKLKTMSMDELASDPLYLFWMKYTKYWNKHHFEG